MGQVMQQGRRGRTPAFFIVREIALYCILSFRRVFLHGAYKTRFSRTEGRKTGTIKEQDIPSCSLRAACGNRTRNSTLGRSHFTVELMPQMGYFKCNLHGKAALKVTDFFQNIISIR